MNAPYDSISSQDFALSVKKKFPQNTRRTQNDFGGWLSVSQALIWRKEYGVLESPLKKTQSVGRRNSKYFLSKLPKFQIYYSLWAL